jgi:uncharacterized membrane protein YdjX (TVP38/TMEM64 family)
MTNKAKMIVLLGSILAIGIGFRFLPAGQWFAELESYIARLGRIGPLVVALGYAVTTVLCLPGSLITIGVASLFGFKTGLIVVLFGANLGALCAFLLSRKLLRKKIARWAETNRKFRSLDRAVDRQGFTVVLLSRLSPAFPFNLLNYLLGLTSIRTGAYALANLFGMLPGMFLYVYIGATVRDVLGGTIGETASTLRQTLQYIGLLAMVALVLIVTRMARNAMREAEPPGGQVANRS